MVSRKDAYDETVDGIETLQIKSDKVDRLFVSLDKTKELREKGRILVQLGKEIDWCKAKTQELA